MYRITTLITKVTSMHRRVKLVGIYCITCTKTQKKYVGSSIDILVRWNDHLIKLLLNSHTNKELQIDFNKYGFCQFNMSILHIVNSSITKDELLCLEQTYIESVPINLTYNNKRARARSSPRLKKKSASIVIDSILVNRKR